MVVEDVSGGFVVVSVVHSSADGGVVVSEDSSVCELFDGVAAFVGLWSVSDDISEAKVFVAWVIFVEFHDGFECIEIAVYVGEDSNFHVTRIYVEMVVIEVASLVQF